MSNSFSSIELLEDRIAPATIVVNSLKDTGSGTLRDALMAASTGDTIVFQHLVGGKTRPLTGTIVLDSPLPSIMAGITIDGPVPGKANGIVINGNGHSIFSITGGAVTLNDLTVSNGKAALLGPTTQAQKGGGLYINDSSLVTLNDVTVSKNHAIGIGRYAYGGGVYISAGSDVTISKSAIVGNTCEGMTNSGESDAYGGGILCRGRLTLENSVVSGNVAQGANNTIDGADGGSAYGGGIYVSKSEASATITACTIKGNKAIGGSGGRGEKKGSNGGEGGYGNGGGVYIWEGAATISGSNISANTAKSGNGGAGGSGGHVGYGRESWGGGISSRGTGASLTLNNSIVSGNKTTAGSGRFNSNPYSSYGGGLISDETFQSFGDTIAKNSAGHGGGIYLNGLAIVTGVTVSQNTAATGGGIQVESGAISVEDSTVALNTASLSGGGFDLLAGTINIHNDTVAGNTARGAAGQGGGIDGLGGAISIISTIIAGDAAHNGADLFSAGSGVVSASYDLFEKTPVAGSYTDDGNNLTGVNPLLKALANNGGPTLTMLLKTGSPAIDHGSNPDNLAYDQRGALYAREIGGQTDIGAVEVG